MPLNPPWVMNSSLLTIQGMGSSLETVFPMGNPPLGAAAFAPSSLTGLILWLDASAIVGVTSGTSLSLWTDSSASLSHASSSAASQPLYIAAGQNNLGVVSFLTGGRAVLISMTSQLVPYTGAIAYASRETTGNQFALGGDGTTNACLAGRQSTNSYGTFAGSFLYAPSNFTNGAWVTQVTLMNTSSTTVSLSAKTAAGNNGSVTSSKFITIGALNVGVQWFNGDIGEITVYNRHLTETERVSVETYLRTKWATL